MCPPLFINRVLLFVLLELVLFLSIGTDFPISFAQARESVCPVPPNSEWTSDEKRVWKTICLGKEADLTQTNLDKSVRRSSVIRAKFLEEIVRQNKYKVPLETNGLGVIGAEVTGLLDLSHTRISYPFALLGCRFDGNVNLQGLRTDHGVSFNGSTFSADLDLSIVEVGDVLDLTHGSFRKVTLQGAHIYNQLQLNDSTFEDKVTMSSMRTGTSVIMRRATFKGDVDLHASYIGRDLSGNNSSFIGVLNLDGTQVAGTISLTSEDPDRLANPTIPTKVRKLDFTSARIERDVYINKAIIEEELMLERLHIGGRLHISETTINARNIALAFSDLGSLFIFASFLPSLDMTGALVHGQLALGTNTWTDDATLTLRGTETKFLIDRVNSWPNKLVLNGFVFLHTYPVVTDTVDFAARDTRWLKDWLSKQVTYSPQPYKQVASVLLSAGYKEKADEILFARKEQERSLATGLDWLFLTLQKYFIGHGYHPILYPLLWMALFVSLGYFLLYWWTHFNSPYFSPPPSIGAALNQHLALWFYSLDRFLPVVNLGKHIIPKIEVSGWLRNWFNFQQIMGYVVAAFLIAGLSGLVEK